MLGDLLYVEVETFLPLIRNREEAEALLAVVLVGQQLDACARVLIANLEHESLLQSLRDASLVSGNDYTVALCPLLQQSLSLSRQRSPLQATLLTRLIEHLCRLEVSIRQYGMQNLTLAQELQGHAVDVAEQKRILSGMELDLCSRINTVIGLSANDKLLSFHEVETMLKQAQTAAAATAAAAAATTADAAAAATAAAAAATAAADAAAAATAANAARHKRGRSEAGQEHPSPNNSQENSQNGWT